jgi:ABC-2 type transport system ATP-binding protein
MSDANKIEITNLTKKFDTLTALNNVTVNIDEGHVFGLIGTNGSGKSTLMRIISGVYKPDEGEVTVNAKPVYDNPAAKSEIFFISDDQYFFPNGTPQDMMHYYRTIYPEYDCKRFTELMQLFKLEPKRKINTFSKGMKKQLSIILGLCSGCRYMLCDETFDGLDPVMRQVVKKLFISEMEQRSFTPIISSHSLRELEDICEHIGLLHQGGIILSKELEDMKLGLHKVQFVSGSAENEETIKSRFKVLSEEKRGSLTTLTLRADRESLENMFTEISPVYWEILPLSLEEIFISETEVLGYDFKNLDV